jgi:predicted TIM-barrel fold metal-dependent hydrolase
MTSLAVDAHFHLWRYRAAELDWITEAMGALRRDFVAADAERELAGAGPPVSPS